MRRPAWIRFPDWRSMDHGGFLLMAFRLERPSFSKPRHPFNAFLSISYLAVNLPQPITDTKGKGPGPEGRNIIPCSSKSIMNFERSRKIIKRLTSLNSEEPLMGWATFDMWIIGCSFISVSIGPVLSCCGERSDAVSPLLFNGFAAIARRAVLQIAVAGGAAARSSFIKAYFGLAATPERNRSVFWELSPAKGASPVISSGGRFLSSSSGRVIGIRVFLFCLPRMEFENNLWNILFQQPSRNLTLQG